MHHPMTIRHRLIGIALVALLTGCADLNDIGMATLASRVQAYAVVNEQLVQGEMTLYPDRSGVVALRVGARPRRVQMSDSGEISPPAPPEDRPIAELPLLNSCVGRFRYTGTTLGAIDLRCNEGTVVDLRMALIGETRGYGYGQTAIGMASLTFGMDPTEARAHLSVAAGKRLVESTSWQSLEMQ